MVRPVDGFSRLMAQTTQSGLAQRCVFWGFRWCCSPFWGWNPPKTEVFGAWIGVFKPTGKILNVWCYRNYCIDFNEILQNDGDHQVVVAGGPNTRPINPRWRTVAILKKPLNRHISATVRPLLIKFRTALQQGRSCPKCAGDNVDDVGTGNNVDKVVIKERYYYYYQQRVRVVCTIIELLPLLSCSWHVILNCSSVLTQSVLKATYVLQLLYTLS